MARQSSVPLFLDQMEMHPTSTFMVDRILFTTSTPEKSRSVRFVTPTTKAPVNSPLSSTLIRNAVISADSSDSEGSVSTPPSSMSSNMPVCHPPISLVTAPARRHLGPTPTPGFTGYGSDSELSELSEISSTSPEPNTNQNGLKESKTIPKPVGEVGRPGRGGYNLEKALKWPPKQLKTVKTFIRARVLNDLDCSKCFSDQPKSLLKAVHEQTLAKFPFLAQYEELWVVDDLIQCRLKYEKTALQRKADAKLAEQARAKVAKRATRKST